MKTAVSLHRKVAFSLGVCFLLFLCLSGGVARAQEESYQAQSEASYTFGQSMHFLLRVKNRVPITGATLFFNTPEMTSTYVVDFDVEVATEVELRHDLALTQLRLAPFTTVRYWWRVVTEDGAFTVEEKTLEYIDDRFQWQTLETVEEEGITVNWTAADSSLGQSALDVVAEARPRLEEIFTSDLTPVEIYIYPSMADLRTALRLTGRDWVGADAIPELNVVLATAVNPRTASIDLGQSIPHELSHLLLYRMSGANYEDVPLWFDEGLATLMESSANLGYEDVLEQAIAANSTIPLAELCQSWPAAEAQARLAYAQSASVVRFIRSEYGNRTLQEMAHVFADGADCESGVRRALGLSASELENAWLQREQPVSAVQHIWQEYALWILLMGGGFGMMGLLLLPIRRK